MKLVKTEPYSMGEIIRAFHEIEESGIFDGVTYQGQKYSFESWLRRVFYTDHGLEPRPQVPGMNKRSYLHRVFEFVRPDLDVLKDTNYQFNYDKVARYWLSAVFGFFKHEGMIMQVNPAYLYALTFFRVMGMTKEFNEVVREARLIPVTDDAKNWVYNQFKRYLNSLLGNDEDPICQVIPDYKEHPVLKYSDQFKWAGRPGLSLSEVNQCLYPLGHVVNFGVSYKLQQVLENHSEKYGRVPTLKEVQDEFKDAHDVEVFSLGCWYKIDKYEVQIEDSARSSQMHSYAKYLTYLSKRSDSVTKTEEFKDELVRRQIYSPAIKNRKSFIKDNAIPDAKQLGFLITNERGSYIGEDGERKKCFMISVTKIRSKRRSTPK